MTVSEVIDANEPRDRVDVPQTTTWADTERDLSAWLGNDMQSSAITSLYGLQDKIMATEDLSPREATQKAMLQVTRPVIAIVFVLTAVFLPVAFLGGLINYAIQNDRLAMDALGTLA